MCFNIAIEGSFDDAQALVKRMFNDPDFAARYDLSAVNSINWARLVAQVVYYVYVGVRLGAPERSIAFAVPTGNFGDVFAGYVAAQMGLPVERLIVATNVNDILHRALSSGDYSQGTVTPTASTEHGHPGLVQFRAPAVRPRWARWSRFGRADARLRRQRKAMRLTNAQQQGAASLFGSARIDAAGMAQGDALGL